MKLLPVLLLALCACHTTYPESAKLETAALPELAGAPRAAAGVASDPAVTNEPGALAGDTATDSAVSLALPQDRRDDRRSSDWGPRDGDWEVTLSGVGVNDEDFDAGGASLAANVGYFLTDQFEIGARQTVTFADAGNVGNTAWDGSTRAFADFHFLLERFVPFIGVNFGAIYGDSVNESLEAAPEAGLKWFLQERAFLLGMAEYQFFFDDDEQIDDAFEDGQWVYTVGFGLLF
jgi:hypothetical protein